MKLDALLEGVETVRMTGNPRCEITGVTADSRQVRAGFLFVAVGGMTHDGWRFVGDALKRGAVAVVSDHERANGYGNDFCHVQVADPRQAIAQVAGRHHGDPSRRLNMVGVTGTNGKTTVAYMIRDILNDAGRTPGLISTVQYEIGHRVIPASRTTPDASELQALLAGMVRAGCDAAVMEVSSHALSQKRVAGVDYDVAVFTNLSRDHLDYHHTMEEYFEAKSLLFRALGDRRRAEGDLAALRPTQLERPVAVINIDDPWGAQLVERVHPAAAVLTYGCRPDAAVRATDIVLGSAGTSFQLTTPWGQAPVRTELLGRFNVSNTLAAISSCAALGLDWRAAAAALTSIARVPGRLEQVKTHRGFQVFVDYAHTDDALAHVLRTLREITANRLRVVFGCGGDRDRSKRPAMGKVASELADDVILTSDNPRHEDPMAILAQIAEGCAGTSPPEVVPGRREAIALALSRAERGDVVLIAGKGHETFQEFRNKTVPFDDRQVVTECLSGRGKHKGSE